MPSFGHAAWFGIGAYAPACWCGTPHAAMAAALRRCARRRRARRVAVRQRRRAAVRRLPRHADARLRADRLGRRVPVRRVDRRRQRHPRRLAGQLGPAGVLLAHACALRLARRCCFAACSMRRLATPCGPGATARCGRRPFGLDTGRIRLAAFAVAGVGGRARGRAVRLCEGQRVPDLYLASRNRSTRCSWCCSAACRRSPGRSSARWPMSGCTTSLLQVTELWRLALGSAIILLVLLFPRGHRRRGAARLDPAASGMTLLQVDGSAQGVRRRAGGGRRFLRGGAGRDAGADRPERRRQEHLLQHARRPAPPGCRRGPTARPGHHRHSPPPQASGGSASAAPSRSPRPSPR